MDWLNWENAAYLTAIILGGILTMVGTKWRMIIREIKEVAETYHAAKKDGKISKEEFYKESKNTYAFITTSERRPFCNFILTKGVIKPDGTVWILDK